MAKYYCPLCKQEVSKTLYEKITGLWQEKEKKLAALRTKEKQLQKKARELEAQFEAEKKKMSKEHQSQLRKQLTGQKTLFTKKLELQEQRMAKTKEQIEKQFQSKLATETHKILKQEREKQKQAEKHLKAHIEKTSRERLDKEKRKLLKEKATLSRQQKLQRDKSEKLLQQYKSLQVRNKKQLESAERKINSLEEQIKKNQTPQMLGLLEEKVFLAKLQEAFPNDEYEHTGKRGDILHYIYDKRNKVGTIVYELKKVTKFNNAHIDQTRVAKQAREADYGILVTNAKRTKTDSGFSIARGIIIIHPAGALVLISILRENLIKMARLSLSQEERNRMIKAVLEYIQSPGFRNSLEEIIQSAIELYENLRKEITDHIRRWKYRLDKYRSIHSNANRIESRVVRLLVSDQERKQLPKQTKIEPISLPEKIR